MRRKYVIKPKQIVLLILMTRAKETGLIPEFNAKVFHQLKEKESEQGW